MSNISRDDRIDDVAAGDIVAVDRGTGEARAYKVVHKDAGEEGSSYVVTY
jgi:RecB family exonuclease